MASLTLFDMELDDRPIEIDTPAIFDKIERELREHLLEQSDEGDSTDGIFDILDNLNKKNIQNCRWPKPIRVPPWLMNKCQR